MALMLVSNSDTTIRKTLKVKLIEMVEFDPCKWRPTGRCMYVDREAPLGMVPGWDEGCQRGEVSVRRSLFDQIVKIVDQAMKQDLDDGSE